MLKAIIKPETLAWIFWAAFTSTGNLMFVVIGWWFSASLFSAFVWAMWAMASIGLLASTYIPENKEYRSPADSAIITMVIFSTIFDLFVLMALVLQR